MDVSVFLHDSIPQEDLQNGLKRRILAYTKDLMIVEVHFEKDAVGAHHTHPHTQCTYIRDGEFLFDIGGEWKLLKKGDSVSFAPNVLHGLKCVEEGTLLDIFTPMREDFIGK